MTSPDDRRGLRQTHAWSQFPKRRPLRPCWPTSAASSQASLGPKALIGPPTRASVGGVGPSMVMACTVAMSHSAGSTPSSWASSTAWNSGSSRRSHRLFHGKRPWPLDLCLDLFFGGWGQKQVRGQGQGKREHHGKIPFEVSEQPSTSRQRSHNHAVIRLYSDERFEVGGVVALPPEEIRYLRTVRRAAMKPIVQSGRASGRSHDRRQSCSHRACGPESLASHPLEWLGFEPSVVKQLIASLSELGVAELSFFKADRSQASLSRLPSEDKQDRLAVEAARQCERPIPLRVTAVEFESLVDASSVATTVVLDEQPDAGSSPVGSEVNLLVVGPEGGWSARERDAFIQASVPRMHLPTPILRVATAAVAATSWCLAHRSLP